MLCTGLKPTAISTVTQETDMLNSTTEHTQRVLTALKPALGALAALGITLLAGCGSTSLPSQTKANTSSVKPMVNPDIRYQSAEEIRRHWSTLTARQQQQDFLNGLSAYFTERGKLEAAAAASEESLNMIDTQSADRYGKNHQRAAILHLEQLILLSRFLDFKRVANEHNWLFQLSQSELGESMWQRMQRIKAHWYWQQGSPIFALNTLLATERTLGPIIGFPTHQQSAIDVAWDWLQTTDTSDIQALGKRNLSADTERLIQMHLIVSDPLMTDNDRVSALSGFNQPLPTEVARFVSGNSTSMIAKPVNIITILLPLTGQYAQQGKAIKQGIIAGYHEMKRSGQQASKLHFIDTGSETDLPALTSEQSQQLTGSDLIIGPLLKPHVQQLSRLSGLPPVIALNDIGNPPTDGSIDQAIVGFYLSPEQEAEALAEQIAKHANRSIMVVHEQSATATRMVEHFLEQLNRLDTKAKIITVPFSDNRNLRLGITEALDVRQSEARTRLLERLTAQSVYSVTRNRRDVDTIVIFADPENTELTVPVIETSISLFDQAPPTLYASSRSFRYQASTDTLRDINQLHFLAMPFLLPNEKTAPVVQLLSSHNKGVSANFLRLFALGQDVISLTTKVRWLTHFNSASYSGLTGIVRSDGTHLSTEFSIAKVVNDKIELVDQM